MLCTVESLVGAKVLDFTVDQGMVPGVCIKLELPNEAVVHLNFKALIKLQMQDNGMKVAVGLNLNVLPPDMLAVVFPRENIVG